MTKQELAAEYCTKMTKLLGECEAEVDGKKDEYLKEAAKKCMFRIERVLNNYQQKHHDLCVKTTN